MFKLYVPVHPSATNEKQKTQTTKWTENQREKRIVKEQDEMPYVRGVHKAHIQNSNEKIKQQINTQPTEWEGEGRRRRRQNHLPYDTILYERNVRCFYTTTE